MCWNHNGERIKTHHHTGNVFVTRDLDLLPFHPKINGLPGLTVEHSYLHRLLRYRVDKQIQRQ